MQTIADGIQVFENERRMVDPTLSLSFLAALNFAKPEAEIDEIFEMVLDHPHSKHLFVGFDINLVPADLSTFTRALPMHHSAQRQGRKINLHLGELFDNDFSSEVLSMLVPDRIGHGVKLLDDPSLVSFLTSHAICLDMCPVSNTRLGVYDWSQPLHPARKAMQLGIPVTLNTDDPVLFQTTLAQEVALAGLTNEEIARIQATGRQYAYRR